MRSSFAMFVLFLITRTESLASEANIYNEGLACFAMIASFPELASLPQGNVVTKMLLTLHLLITPICAFTNFQFRFCDSNRVQFLIVAPWNEDLIALSLSKFYPSPRSVDEITSQVSKDKTAQNVKMNIISTVDDTQKTPEWNQKPLWCHFHGITCNSNSADIIMERR